MMGKSFFITLLLYSFLSYAHGQIFIPELDNPAKQQVFINMGMEPEWVTTIGFRQRVNHTESKSNFYLGESFKFAPLIVSKGAWRLNFTQAADRQISQNWKGMISNDIYLAHNKNRAGTMNGLGFDLRGALLYVCKKWIKGFEVGWQYTAFTHIRHSAVTQATFDERYPHNVLERGPENGWYDGTASRFRLGFLASRNLSNRFAFQFAIGSMVSMQKQDILLGFSHAQVPLYLNTQLNYGLK